MSVPSVEVVLVVDGDGVPLGNISDHRWPRWIPDGEDLLDRAITQHSDMNCGCSFHDQRDDLCSIGWLLELLRPGSVI